MRPTSRVLRLLPAALAVWCLGCESFEQIVESLAETRAPEHVLATGEVPPSRDDDRAGAAEPANGYVETADACDCVLGHAAVVSVPTPAHRPPLAPIDFVDRPHGTVLPPPEPPLRPPVA